MKHINNSIVHSKLDSFKLPRQIQYDSLKLPGKILTSPKK